MKNIEFSNCMQVIGIIGILPNRVCGRARSNKLMDLQISNNLPSETEELGWVHFEGGGFDGILNINGFVEISINGYENREYQSIQLWRNYTYCVSQHLFSLTLWSLLQRHLNESNPTDQNRVKVSIRYESDDPCSSQEDDDVDYWSDDTCSSIIMWGVHVECTCPPREDDAIDGYSIKGWGSKKRRTR